MDPAPIFPEAILEAASRQGLAGQESRSADGQDKFIIIIRWHAGPTSRNERAQ